MTQEEKKVVDEIYERLKKMCDGREFCKGCPHVDKHLTEYNGGCAEYVAIQMILEARNG